MQDEIAVAGCRRRRQGRAQIGCGNLIEEHHDRAAIERDKPHYEVNHITILQPLDPTRKWQFSVSFRMMLGQRIRAVGSAANIA
ncbi:hypothetical protein D3C85_1572160 [compost metagenome]